MKKIFSLVTLLLVLFTLFACGTSQSALNTNTTSYDSNKTYATLGEYKITEGELYTSLKATGYSSLVTEISSRLVKKQNPAKNLSVSANAEELDEIINEKCYGTKDLATLNSETKASALTKFVDNMLILGLNCSEDNIYTDDVRAYFLDTLRNKYYAKSLLTDSNSKYYYANEYEKENGEFLLDEDGNQIANPYYVSQEDLEKYYDSNMKSAVSFKAIVLGFATVKDANSRFTAAGASIEEDGTLTITGDKEATFTAVYNGLFGTTDPDFTLDSDSYAKYPEALRKIIDNLKAGEATSLVQQVGSLKYLVYKITDKDEVSYADYANKDEVLEQKLDSLVTSTFITKMVSELVSNSTVVIYDATLSKLYKNDNSDYEELTADKWQDSFKNKVANIDGEDLTVEEFYQLLEKQNGAITAMGELSEKALLAKYASKLTNDDMTAINTTIANTQLSFIAGELSGYPTTLTLDEFKYLYYGATTDEGVKNKVEVEKIWTYAIKDYPADYFELLAKYSKNYYDTYYSLDIHHVLLSIDYNMDGTLDDPEIFMLGLDDNEVVNFQNALVTLASKILAEADYIANTAKFSTYNAALKFVAKQFAAGEDLLSDPTDNWNNYKAYNLAVKVEDLGDVNTSNGSNYVKPFYQAVQALFETLTESYQEEDTKDYKYQPTTVTYDDLVMTNYGFHILTSDGTSELKSATSSSTTEYKITWNGGDEETITYANENKYPSLNQIKMYAAQMAEKGSSDITSTIETCIKYFYTTFTTRYESSTFQTIRFVYQNVLGNIAFADSTKAEYVEKYYEAQMRTFDSYKDYSSTAKHAFAGWWEDFGCTTSSK